MENQFVPYEQALALKELGFDEPCLGFYDTFDYEKVAYGYSEGLNKAPLYQQAFKWFRDNHNLYHRIDPSDIKDISYTIFDEYDEIYEDSCYWSYEQAELNCLKKLIKLKSK